MGWGSGGIIFKRVTDALLEGGAPDDVITGVCSDLIGLLRSEDWDTHRDSLERYSGDPAVVAAFREHDIHLPCALSTWDGDYECALDDGHAGDHDDGNGHRWRDISPDALVSDARDLAKALFGRLRDFIPDDKNPLGEGLSWDVLPDWLTGDGLGRALWAHGAPDNHQTSNDEDQGHI